MQKGVISLLYIRLQDKVEEPIPIYRVARQEKIPDGKLQIYYASLAAQEKRKQTLYERLTGFFMGKREKEDSMSVYRRQIQELTEQIKPQLCFFHPKVQMLLQEPEGIAPLPVWQALLRQMEITPDIYIELPESDSWEALELMKELLEPYFIRIRQITFLGEENRVYSEMEEYLYEEYGILAGYARQWNEESSFFHIWDDSPSAEVEMAGNREITSTLAVDYLDTRVKNGYNTRVN